MKYNERYERIIRKAEEYFGDLIGEYANQYYEEQGGSIGFCEGRVQLTNEEMKECMGEALDQVYAYSSLTSGVEMGEVIEYWFCRDYGKGISNKLHLPKGIKLSCSIKDCKCRS